MTTRNYTSVVDHSSNAGYIAWRDEFFANIIACGLVQTSDTGQYTIGAGTRPAVNTVGDYAILRFPDSSLYLRIETGTGSSATFPQMWATVGEGSNGSGTLTGQLSTRTIWTNLSAPVSTATSFTTYICVTNDCFNVLWKASGRNVTARNRALGHFTVMKTVNSSGAATSTGYMVLLSGSSTGSPLTTSQCVRRAATAATYGQSSSFCVAPGASTSSPANSLDGSGNIQAYTHWGLFPTVLPMLHSCSVRDADVTELNTFTVTLVGATPHIYLNLGLQSNIGEASLINTGGFTYSMAFLYE